MITAARFETASRRNDRFLLLAHGQVAGSLTRDDVDASDLTRLMAGGEEFAALTTALTALHPELGER